MTNMEKVNQLKRGRSIEARDREEIIKKAISLHEQGVSRNKSSKILGVSTFFIQYWFKKMGIEVDPPGVAGKKASKIYQYDENYFETIDTPNKAYIVGFILGDGCVYDEGKRKRLSIALAEEDENTVYQIAKELKAEQCVKKRKNKAENEQDKIQLLINSTKICNDLIQIGVKPRKTGNEKWIDFKDDNLQWAFLRGLFDADGHIRVYERNGYTKARFGITSSEEMLKSVLSFLKKYKIANRVNSIFKKQGCFDLYVSSVKDIQKIHKYLYQDDELKMERKYKKFSSLMI